MGMVYTGTVIKNAAFITKYNILLVLALLQLYIKQSVLNKNK